VLPKKQRRRCVRDDYGSGARYAGFSDHVTDLGAMTACIHSSVALLLIPNPVRANLSSLFPHPGFIVAGLVLSGSVSRHEGFLSQSRRSSRFWSEERVRSC